MPEENDNSQGHPAWEPFLKDVPEEFQSYVTKAFEEWDKGVVPKSKLQELEEQYNPYKEFLDNQIDVEALREAYGVRQALEDNPENFIKQAVEIFGLENLLKASEETPPGGDDEEYEFGDDITKHPAFAAMQKQLEEVTGTLTKEQQAKLEEKQAEEFDQYLETLQDKYKEAGTFDEAIVSSLIAAGWDGDEAVKHYFGKFNQAPADQQQQQQQTTPVVMGGDDSTGSGIPQEPVNMGALKKNDLNDVVLQFLAEAEKNSQ